MQAPDDIQADDAAQASLVTRFGTAVGAGLVCALLASIAPAVRLGGSLLPLVALATPAAIALVGVLRRARAGARVVVGDRGAPFVLGLSLWAILELAFSFAFASVLRKHTHHHGLAGVTFAVVASGAGIVLALLVARIAARATRLSARAQRALAAGSAALAFGALAAAGTQAPAAVFDAIVLATSCLLASSRAVAQRRVLALAGVPAAAVVVALGFATLHRGAVSAEALASGAPIHALLLALFGR